MMEQRPLAWSGDLDAAIGSASKTGKQVLLFYHSKDCSSCRMMIAKTLPDTRVSKFIDRRFIPVALEASDPAAVAAMQRYGFEWAPTFVVLDGSGNEVYRWVGYLPPEDFCSQLMFAEGRAMFGNRDWDRAIKCYDAVASRFPGSEAAPEAMYYAGVARYEKTHDASHLEDTRRKLTARYPGSHWAKKASEWGK